MSESVDTSQAIVVMRDQLQVGDVWWVYGGWHRVTAVEHGARGNTPDQVRSTVRIQALTAEDGAAAWGLMEWSTGLRSDLAATDACRIVRGA